MSSESWRCVVCNKPKDLRGPHLNGKAQVRSDCWPCAVKRVFKLVNGEEPPATQPARSTTTAAAAGATPAAAAAQAVNPFLTAAPNPFAAPKAGTAAADAPAPAAPKAAAAPSPFGTAAAAAPSPFHGFGAAKPAPSPFAAASPSDANNNPFASKAGGAAPLLPAPGAAASSLFKAPAPAAPAKASPFAGVFGAPPPSAAANPFLQPSAASQPRPASTTTTANAGPALPPAGSKPAGGSTSTMLVMQSQSPSKPSPPFTFVTAKTVPPPLAAGTVGSSHATGSGGPDAAKPLTSPDDVWRCAACGKAKDLRGSHLDGKAKVRSDCWPCAVKRVFVRHDPQGLEPLTAGSPSGAAADKPQRPSSAVSQQSSPGMEPQRSFSCDSLMASTTAVPNNTPSSGLTTPKLAASASPFVFCDPIVPSSSDHVSFFIPIGQQGGSSSSTSPQPRVGAAASSFAEALLRQLRVALLTPSGLDGLACHVQGSICTVFLPSPAPSAEVVGALLLAAERRLVAAPSAPLRIFTDASAVCVAASLYKLCCREGEQATVFGPSSDAGDAAAQGLLLAAGSCVGDATGTLAASKMLLTRTGTAVPPSRSGAEALRLGRAADSSRTGQVDIVLVSPGLAVTAADLVAIAGVM